MDHPGIIHLLVSVGVIAVGGPLLGAALAWYEARRDRQLQAAQTPEALVGKVAHGRSERERAESLRLLVRVSPSWATTQSTARGALADPSARVRVIAARLLGDEGFETLCRVVDDARAPLDARAEAVRHLGRTCGSRAASSIAAALDAPDPEVRCAALEAVAAARQESLIDRVLELAQAPEAAVAEEATRALCAIGGPRAEAMLINLLDHHATEVRLEAVAGLGATGATRDAVAALIQHQHGSLAGPAALAVGRIQARLGDAEPGRLSLPEADEVEGAVTLADRNADSGRLSLASAAGSRAATETVGRGPKQG